MRLKTLLGLCLALASLVATTGCGERRNASGRAMETRAAKGALGLKDLEAQSGLSLPTNAVLLHFSEVDLRDQNWRGYEWAVFSPAPIALPPMRAPGVKDYLRLPLSNTVKFVESYMGRRRIPEPEAALCTHWETNGFGFEATLVRSPKGDYLVVQCGRIK